MQTDCRYANIPSIILNIYDKRILNTNICICGHVPIFPRFIIFDAMCSTQKAICKAILYDVNTVLLLTHPFGLSLPVDV